MEEFLLPLDISAYRLAKDIGIPQTRISEILKGRRKLTLILVCGWPPILATQHNFGWVCNRSMILKRQRFN